MTNKTNLASFLSLSFALLSFSISAFAAAPVNTYQVTGPVVDISEKAITVQKGKEKWEIARDASTQAKGEIKKGDKVTVRYFMTATAIDVKK